jgi:XapX domain-containing protein
LKTALGIAIAFAVGLACRLFAIPSPAPPALTGALLVLAMTLGYAATDRLMQGRARNAAGCAGPTGLTKAGTPRAPGETQ